MNNFSAAFRSGGITIVYAVGAQQVHILPVSRTCRLYLLIPVVPLGCWSTAYKQGNSLKCGSLGGKQKKKIVPWGLIL